MIAIAIGIFVLLAILLVVYANLRTKKAEAGKTKSKEDRQVEKQPKTVKIGDCVVDLEASTCITHKCEVSSSEPCREYSMPYLLSGSLSPPYFLDEWRDKYEKALMQRKLGKKEYRKRYTIPYLGGKLGIATLVCWGITIILGLAQWIGILMPSISDLEFPALMGTFGLSACILTIIVLFKV